LVWQQGFFFVLYAFLLFLQILWTHMNYSLFFQEQGHVCFVVVATSRCFIIVILKTIWLCLKIFLLSSNSWFLKPFQIITHLRKFNVKLMLHVVINLSTSPFNWPFCNSRDYKNLISSEWVNNTKFFHWILYMLINIVDDHKYTYYATEGLRTWQLVLSIGNSYKRCFV
jgi:hypothetical protein